MQKVNHYIESVFGEQNNLLEEVLESIKEKGMPSISVSSSAGKLLSMLVAMTGAKNILEIGALGGYSGIFLARGLGSNGSLTSLELEEKHAELAKNNLAKAGFNDQVTYMTGPALESLKKLAKANKRFDFFFIDADKDNYPHYLEQCIKLAEPGAVITIDNVLARGSVADEEMEPRRHTALMKKFNQTIADHPQLEAVILPIGDGITVARVIDKQ